MHAQQSHPRCRRADATAALPVCPKHTLPTTLAAPNCPALPPLPAQVVLPINSSKVLMLELAEQVAANVLVHHMPGIMAVSSSRAAGRQRAVACGDGAAERELPFFCLSHCRLLTAARSHLCPSATPPPRAIPCAGAPARP